MSETNGLCAGTQDDSPRPLMAHRTVLMKTLRRGSPTAVLVCPSLTSYAILAVEAKGLSSTIRRSPRSFGGLRSFCRPRLT